MRYYKKGPRLRLIFEIGYCSEARLRAMCFSTWFLITARTLNGASVIWKIIEQNIYVRGIFFNSIRKQVNQSRVWHNLSSYY